MKAFGLMAVSVSVLIGCTMPEPRFEQMTEAELLAYNETVPLEQQVYCRKEVQVGSHIRKNVCVTVQEMIWGTPRTLNTASSSTSIPYHRQ